MSGTFQSVHDWRNDTLDKYIAIMHISTTDTVYGWIRVNCGHGCLIKDYSFGSELIGIDEIDNDDFKTFPNPANDKIYFEQNNAIETEIKIVDLLGRQSLPIINNTSQKFEIDISTLKNGIYFIIVKTDEGTFSKRFAIQK